MFLIDVFFFIIQLHRHTRKKNLNFPNMSRSYELPITSTLRCRKLKNMSSHFFHKNVYIAEKRVMLLA